MATPSRISAPPTDIAMIAAAGKASSSSGGKLGGCGGGDGFGTTADEIDCAVMAAVVRVPAIKTPGVPNAVVMAAVEMATPDASGLMEKSTTTEPATMELMMMRLATILSAAATSVAKSASNLVLGRV